MVEREALASIEAKLANARKVAKAAEEKLRIAREQAMADQLAADEAMRTAMKFAKAARENKVKWDNMTTVCGDPGITWMKVFNMNTSPLVEPNIHSSEEVTRLLSTI